jgi:hypothetical protein
MGSSVTASRTAMRMVSAAEMTGVARADDRCTAGGHAIDRKAPDAGGSVYLATE